MASLHSTLLFPHSTDIEKFPLDGSRPYRRKDHTGHRFGRLVVQEMLWENDTSYALCRCDCGSTKRVRTALLHRHTHSCGCLRKELARGPHIHQRKDYTGHRFERLVVEEMVWGTKNHTYALCRCDCGGTKKVGISALVSKATKSCGCLQKENHFLQGSARPDKRRDYTGHRFGRLVVEQMLWEVNQRTYTVCRCDCGVVKKVSMGALLNNTESCGCLHKERTSAASRKDMTDGRFGMLVVQQTFWEDGERYVHAVCDCGGTWSGLGEYLQSGDTGSCGCSRAIPPDERRMRSRLRVLNRRARRRALPDQFDESNLAFMSQYWGNTCAVCGRDEGFWHLLALDHFIPLVDANCPGTVPWNMLPLCHTRKKARGFDPIACCNQSKSDKDPLVWLTSKLGPRKAKAKLRAIEQYFAAARAFEMSRGETVAL